MPPKVVELTDLPHCCSNTYGASVLAHGSSVFVAYAVQDNDADFKSALLHFKRAIHVIAMGPNDEAFGNHPYYSLGLQAYTLQEIVQSPWISEVSSVLNKDGLRNWFPDARHFVLAFKETCVDVLAQSVEFTGTFHGRTAAIQHALTLSADDPYAWY